MPVDVLHVVGKLLEVERTGDGDDGGVFVQRRPQRQRRQPGCDEAAVGLDGGVGDGGDGDRCWRIVKQVLLGWCEVTVPSVYGWLVVCLSWRY